MRWMQPPRLDDPALDRFDPVREGARYRLSPEQSLALWKRVCTEASDDAGRRSDEHARRRFRELATQGGRLGPDVGKRTRVELDAGVHDAESTNEARPTSPGRDSLVAAEARRQQSSSAPAMSDARGLPSSSAPAMSDAREQPSPTAPAIADAGWRRPLATPVTAVAPWQPSQSMRTAAAALQMRQAGRAVGLDEARRRELAAAGLSGPGGPLPHLDRVQRSFGRHDVSAVRAHVDGNAAQASEQIGALAYASDGQVAFHGAPDLHLAAHEAAHVVQQRAGVQLSGGVGAAGDVYERHADAVADAVVAGGSAEALLDQHAGATAPAGGAIQLTQDPDAQRQSRVSVATSVQAYRVTYPDARRGGLLTQALLTRLRDRRASVADTVARTGEGTRQFGAQPASGEERAGTSLGASAAPPTGTAAQRRAVVIGNGTYNPGTHMGSTVEPTRPLPNSPSDAAAIATALRTRGYNVVSLTNQTAAQIDASLRAQLAGLGAGSEVVFFYSGHGTPEGLIGSDGQAFTPAQALALRNQARQAQVDLTFATDACHAGIFADAIRGAELTDTRAAAQRGAAAGASNGPIVALLDAAIATQSAKDAYNRTMQQWWAHRYELEVPINAGNTSDPVMDAWTAHYNLGATHWNTFIVPANAALVTLHTTATAAGHPLRALTLQPLGATYDNTGEMAVQAGLDDVDTLTNEVLTVANSRLPP
jgi:Caspase domain/Domain of unknown function (DUF4157)